MSTEADRLKSLEYKRGLDNIKQIYHRFYKGAKVELTSIVDVMSSGYAAVLDIILDIMMKMEKNARGFYNIQGVVLIDEVETHLHIVLQRKILPFLINMFPNIQFIVSTHSPFILTSISDVVIYDLEKRIIVDKGMQNLPYAGVVEGYFGADTLSKTLKEKFERYKEIVSKKTLEDEDYVEIVELEF